MHCGIGIGSAPEQQHKHRSTKRRQSQNHAGSAFVRYSWQSAKCCCTRFHFLQQLGHFSFDKIRLNSLLRVENLSILDLEPGDYILVFDYVPDGYSCSSLSDNFTLLDGSKLKLEYECDKY